GQSALVLGDPAMIRSPFYLMAPPVLLIPLLLLATAATIIASQSIISGAFSVTQQAVQLGYLPRINIVHTSDQTRGQVFAPSVNLLLFLAVIALVLGFRSSTALAAAFGLAVTATMVLTTLMIGFVVFRIWRWNPVFSLPLYIVLLAIDVGLFAASATKFADGGWLPLTIAVVLVLLFTTWRKGRKLLEERLAAEAMSIDLLLKSTTNVQRIPATAVYLTSSRKGVPPALLHNMKCNHVLHARILLVTAETALTPRVAPDARLVEEDLGGGITRVVIRYGFSEAPDVPSALAGLKDGFEPMKTSYFLSRQTLVPSRGPGMALWRERVFAAMMRNAQTPMSYFKLPVNKVVELGSQIEI
ncbi:MAG: KUP/HAK/KT family potassium transporter, partial [Rhodospirillaceae bacterium]